MDNGIYLTQDTHSLKMLHVEDGELLHVLVDQGAPLSGALYVGRVQAKEGPNFWVDIGFKKPALLQRPRHNYTQGEKVFVQLKRPPLLEKYILKNAEVSDAISLSGAFLYYTPGKKGINFSAQIRDKDWKKEILDCLEDVAQEGEGLVLKGRAYTQNAATLTQDLQKARQRWASLQDLYEKTNKVGTQLHSPQRPWLFDTLENVKDPVFTDNADLMVAMKGAGVSENRLTFDLKPHWQQEAKAYLESVLEEMVPLQCGGYLLIEEGHTLTAIDVNTAAPGDSKLTQGVKLHSDNDRFEFAQLALNESIRHLYLRKIGGIVLIDLPRLSNAKHQKALLKMAKSYEDSNLQVLGFTKSGLLELTKRKDEVSLKQILGVS